jgi:hypothetical protein
MTLAGNAIKNEAKTNQYLTPYTIDDEETAAAVVEATKVLVIGVVVTSARCNKYQITIVCRQRVIIRTVVVPTLLEGNGDGEPKPGKWIVNHSVCSASHIAFTARLRSSTNACAAISIAC